MSATPTTAPRYRYTICSQCGQDFGPGDEGFSHCSDHEGKRPAFTSALDAMERSKFRATDEAVLRDQIQFSGSAL